MKVFAFVLSLCFLVANLGLANPTPTPEPKRPPISGPPIIIVGDPDPDKDPCRHAPELEECGGDGGEPAPKDPKEPETPEDPKGPPVS